MGKLKKFLKEELTSGEDEKGKFIGIKILISPNDKENGYDRMSAMWKFSQKIEKSYPSIIFNSEWDLKCEKRFEEYRFYYLKSQLPIR